MKKKSAGIIYHDGHKLLFGIGSIHKKFDLPKGNIEDHETPIEAAIREMKEETSIILDETNMKFLGEFNYTPKKNLFLFEYKVEKLPDINIVKCISYFIHKDNKKYPEFYGHEFVPFNKIEKRKHKFFPNMYNLLLHIKTILN